MTKINTLDPLEAVPVVGETAPRAALHVVETDALPADEIRSFIERAEALIAQKDDILAEIKEVFAEAKGRGYRTGALRMIIKRRARNKDDLAEEDAILDLYLTALGMA